MRISPYGMNSDQWVPGIAGGGSVVQAAEDLWVASCEKRHESLEYLPYHPI